MHQANRRCAPPAQPFEPASRRRAPTTAPAATLAAALCAAVGLLAVQPTSAEPSRYDAAHVDYEIGHFEKAFAEFASLADEGHCDAARMAQQMVRYGRPLYATEFKVAPERLERWQRLPACAVALAGGNTERRAP